MVNPALQLEHMVAPSLVQSAPVFGEPFGQLHTFAATNTQADTHTCVCVCVCVFVCVCVRVCVRARMLNVGVFVLYVFTHPNTSFDTS